MRSSHRSVPCTSRSACQGRLTRVFFFGVGALALVAGGSGRLEAAERRVQKGAIESTRVVPQVVESDLRDLPLAREWEPGDPIKEIPRRHTHPPAGASSAPGGEPKEDSLLRLQQRGESEAVADLAFPSPILNFAGQGFTGVTPPDTVGDVGPNHFVQAVNHGSGSSITIYSKSGSVLAGPFILDTLGTGGACASGFGDPVVLYDAPADRWLLSEFSGGGNNLCVYISRTSDPISGGWFRYQFTTPNFPDYPKYGVWPDAYYVSSNENNPAAYALDRNRMLQGLSATSQRFTAPDLGGFGFQALTPADLDGSTLPPTGAPGLFMRHRDDEAHNPPGTPQDFVELWEFHVDWQTPANSTFSGPTNIAVTDFSSELCGFFSFSCFPQPGTGTRLDPLREVVMFRLQYRNYGSYQVLAGNFVTDADGEGGGDPVELGGVRWFELRKTSGAWFLQQEGTYSPDSTNRWMGSASFDGSGNFAVGYNVSSASVFPGLRYAGRLASDPPGSLPQGEGTIINGTASNSSNRYGDYSAMSVDPSDDCTFWFTGEYNAAAAWSTRIATFKFTQCGAPPTPDFTLSCNPATLAIPPGSSGNSTCSVGSLGNFNGPVTLTCAGLPGGASCSYNPNPVTPPANGSVNSALTLTVGGGVPTGSYPFQARGVSGALSHTFNMTLNVSSELLVNGGFEGGDCNPWVLTGTGIRCNQTGPNPHGGTGYVEIGGGVNRNGRAYQQVAIPPSAPANLTFWLNISTSEPGPAGNDVMRVEVRDTSDVLLSSVATYSNLNAGPYSQKGAFSLAAFAGQTIRLYFSASNNGSLPTTFRLDDVSLQ